MKKAILILFLAVGFAVGAQNFERTYPFFDEAYGDVVFALDDGFTLAGLAFVDFPAENFIFPGEYKSSKVRVRPIRNAVVDSGSDPKLKVYPNPANTHIVAQYKVPDNTSQSNLIIRTIEGKQLENHSLTGFDNQLVISVGKLIPSIYIVDLYADGKIVSSVKINIVR